MAQKLSSAPTPIVPIRFIVGFDMPKGVLENTTDRFMFLCHQEFLILAPLGTEDNESLKLSHSHGSVVHG